MSCAEIRRGVDPRLINAVETLRQLQADGFSIDAIVEVALGRPGDGLGENHSSIVQIYREAIGEALRRPTLAAVERVPVDPDAPVFANFVARWPDPIAPDHRNVVAADWRKLTMTERARAITGIEGWMASRHHSGFSGPGPAHAYLRDRGWKRTPAVLPAFPLTERTSA